MGNRANLNSIHIGHSHAWKSEWFGSIEYQTMLSQDYKIREYLSNIFFNFKLPVSEFSLKRYANHLMCIDMDLYFPEDIKDKFYLFQNLEDQLYDCIDSLIYYLKNELYLYNISVSRRIQDVMLMSNQIHDASLVLFKQILNRNIFLCSSFSIYYKTLHHKFIFQYFNEKIHNSFYNLISKLLSNMFISKSSSVFANTISSAPHALVLSTLNNTDTASRLSYCMKIYIFIQLLQYNSIVNSRLIKYIVTLVNIFKTIFSSLLPKDLLVLFLLQLRLSNKSISKLLGEDNILKLLNNNKPLSGYNLRYTSPVNMLYGYLKNFKGSYIDSSYIKLQLRKYLNKPFCAIVYSVISSNSSVENTYLLPYIFNTITSIKLALKKYKKLVTEHIQLSLLTKNMLHVLPSMFLYLAELEKSLYNMNKHYNLSSGIKTLSSAQLSSNISHSILARIYNLLSIKWSIYKFEVVDDYFFRNIIFKQITYHIETTISEALKLHCVFLPNLYIKDVIPFNSAKLISQYIAYELEKGSPVSEIFRDLKSIHVGDSYKRNEFFKRMYKFTHSYSLGSDTFKSYILKLSMMNPFDVKNQERLDIIKLDRLQFSQFCSLLSSRPSIPAVLNLCLNNIVNYLEVSGLLYIIALTQNYSLYFKNSYIFDLRLASKLKQWHEFMSVLCISELNSLRARAPMMYLKKFPVQGVKIAASGTFKRGNEATVKWYSEGKMPRQTIAIDVEQYVTPAFTRNGVIGINVSLFCNTDRFQDEIELKSEEFLDYFKLNARDTFKHKGDMFRIRNKKTGRNIPKSEISLKQRSTQNVKTRANKSSAAKHNSSMTFNKIGHGKTRFNHKTNHYDYKDKRFIVKSKFLKRK